MYPIGAHNNTRNVTFLLPTMPRNKPVTLKTRPSVLYTPLHARVLFASSRFASGSSAFLLLEKHVPCGSAIPKPHRMYPAVQKNDVGSQPCVRYVRAPAPKHSNPRFTCRVAVACAGGEG